MRTYIRSDLCNRRAVVARKFDNHEVRREKEDVTRVGNHIQATRGTYLTSGGSVRRTQGECLDALTLFRGGPFRYDIRGCSFAAVITHPNRHELTMSCVALDRRCCSYRLTSSPAGDVVRAVFRSQ